MGRSVGIIGPGRLGTTLALALAERGYPVVAAAGSPTGVSARNLAGQLLGCRVATVEEVVARADFAFLTVPDNEIASLAETLPWRPGQWVVHCSGAMGVSVLDPAVRRGALTGAFHPIRVFADPNGSVELLAGSTVTIDNSSLLADELSQIADLLGMSVLSLPPDERELYHASVSLVGYAVSVLLEAARVWESRLGIPRTAAVRAMLPLLIARTARVETHGLAGALAEPVSRGDVDRVRGHIEVLDQVDPDLATLYSLLLVSQIGLVRASGRLTDQQLHELQELL